MEMTEKQDNEQAQRMASTKAFLIKILTDREISHHTSEDDDYFYIEFPIYTDKGVIRQFFAYSKESSSLRIYSQFPVAVPKEKTGDVLLILNTLNDNSFYTCLSIDDRGIISSRVTLLDGDKCDDPRVIIAFLSMECELFKDNFDQITSAIFSNDNGSQK
jgi:hypothetical protein